MASANRPRKRTGIPPGKPFPKGNQIGVRFKPGQSGNPHGRPRKLIELEREVREAEGPRLLTVLASMRERACGVLVEGTDSEGERHVYETPPDPNAARVWLARVMGPERVSPDDVEAGPEADTTWNITVGFSHDKPVPLGAMTTAVQVASTTSAT